MSKNQTNDPINPVQGDNPPQEAQRERKGLKRTVARTITEEEIRKLNEYFDSFAYLTGDRIDVAMPDDRPERPTNPTPTIITNNQQPPLQPQNSGPQRPAKTTYENQPGQAQQQPQVQPAQQPQAPQQSPIMPPKTYPNQPGQAQPAQQQPQAPQQQPPNLPPKTYPNQPGQAQPGQQQPQAPQQQPPNLPPKTYPNQPGQAQQQPQDEPPQQQPQAQPTQQEPSQDEPAKVKKPSRPQRTLEQSERRQVEKEILSASSSSEKQPIENIVKAQLALDLKSYAGDLDLLPEGSLMGKRYQAVRKALEEGNDKEANRHLEKLQKQLVQAKSIRTAFLTKLNSRFGELDTAFGGSYDEQGRLVFEVQTIKNLAKEHGCSKKLLESILQDIRAEAEAILPEGFDPPQDKGTGGEWTREKAWPNPALPKGARPADVTLSEAVAINVYSCAGGCDPDGNVAEGDPPYRQMNRKLWGDKKPDPPFDKTFEALQSAFKKAKPFPEPVPVRRGLAFDESTAAKFVEPFKKAEGQMMVIWLKGFISTSTTTNGAFTGAVMLNIKAKVGLDLLPYTYIKRETELLLNHDTPVRVLKVHFDEESKVWTIDLEQLVLKEQRGQ